jgi:hypothetical protein
MKRRWFGGLPGTLRVGVESAARWLVLGAILGWVAMTILGSVDINATARLFSAMANEAGRLVHHV